MELIGKRWDNDRAHAMMHGKNIRSLDLINTAIEDTFFTESSTIKSLKSVHICSDVITDKGIISIVEKCHLNSLLLSDVPNVSDHALKSIAKCESIRELYIAGTGITDRTLGLLKQLPKLWSLNISNTSITDVGIHNLGSQTINLLSFDNCEIEGLGFDSWKTSEKMSFYGEGSQLNDKGFATACSSFAQLWNVIISNTNVGDVGIKSLLAHSPIMLRVNGTRITNMGISWVIDKLPVEELGIDSQQQSQLNAALNPVSRHFKIVVY